MGNMTMDQAINLIYDAEKTLNEVYSNLHDIAYGQHKFTPEETDQIRTALYHGPINRIVALNSVIAKINIL